jgi:ribosomal protein S18 acetylase RimI-like enzyme
MVSDGWILPITFIIGEGVLACMRDAKMADVKGSAIPLTIRPMLIADIPSAQAIGKATWSKVASEDLGREVEYPTRPAKIIQAAIEEEPLGCFAAMLGDRMVGTAYSHVWGSVGWVGPVEVLPEHQGTGIGKALMDVCHGYLGSRGCRVFGVETMSDNERNKKFYTGLGYRSVGVTVFAEKKLRPAGYFVVGIRELTSYNLAQNSEDIRALSSAVYPGMDCTSEFRMVLDNSLGKAFLFHHDGIPKGVALLMDAPLEGLHMVSIRLLLTDPEIPDRGAVMSSLMAACEQSAISSGNDRVFTSSSITNDISHILVERDYKISASNVRFIRGDDYSEAGGTNIIAWAG